MHIKKAQEALLSNHEVLLHLTSTAASYNGNGSTDPKTGGTGRPIPKGLKDMLQDGLTYLQSHDQNSALTHLLTTHPQRPMTLYKGPHSLFRVLAPYGINKAEYLQIYNLRPQTTVALCLILEEWDTRFTDTQLEEIITAIGNVFDEQESQIPSGVEEMEMKPISNKLLGAAKRRNRRRKVERKGGAGKKKD